MRIASLLVFVVFALSGCYLFHVEPGEDAHADAHPEATDAGSHHAADGGTCSVSTYQVADKFEPIDMVWVVDSSRSMADEQARIQQTMNQFVADIMARSFDVHLVMMTANNIVPPPLGTDPSRYLFVQHAIGDHDALQTLLDELPNYQKFLRPTAALHFVVVSDDESALSADDFFSQMRARLQRSFVVHAVASPDVDGQPCRSQSAVCMAVAMRYPALCGAAAIGAQYYALAQDTGGLQISICLDDWSQVFGPLLDAVGRTVIPCTIDLPEMPASDTQVTLRKPDGSALQFAQVASEAACAQQNAYYLVNRAATPQLTLCPVACGSTTITGVELRVALDCTLAPN